MEAAVHRLRISSYYPRDLSYSGQTVQGMYSIEKNTHFVHGLTQKNWINDSPSSSNTSESG